mmetsp:Transcript_25972/g.103891  ORF Transcript_25972/g.103891 Transcript_25972/m.103891 type:complete len:225 (+) Transcript_25972:1557-2231(+)
MVSASDGESTRRMIRAKRRWAAERCRCREMKTMGAPKLGVLGRARAARRRSPRRLGPTRAASEQRPPPNWKKNCRAECGPAHNTNALRLRAKTPTTTTLAIATPGVRPHRAPRCRSRRRRPRRRRPTRPCRRRAASCSGRRGRAKSRGSPPRRAPRCVGGSTAAPPARPTRRRRLRCRRARRARRPETTRRRVRRRGARRRRPTCRPPSRPRLSSCPRTAASVR